MKKILVMHHNKLFILTCCFFLIICNFSYGKESYFIEPMNLKGNKFPTLSTEIDFKTEVVVIRGTTINEMITDAKNKELSYLAITDSNQILSKIYDEEHNYLYLEKIYDSKENNLKFNIKIFKIDFNKFEI